MIYKNVFKFLPLFLAVLLCYSCGDDDDMTVTPTPGGDAPIAAFSAAPNELEVVFTNTSSNATSYSWDFGDGSNPVTDVNPTYTYAAAGTYTVTLTASNAAGVSDSFSAGFTLASANEKAALLAGEAGSAGKTWKLLREGTAIFLASDPDLTNVWWEGTSNDGQRPCIYDDSFTFTPDGTFAFDDAGTFWAEFGVFNSVDGCEQNTTAEACYEATAANLVNECGDDVSAWLSNANHSYTFDPDMNRVTLSGMGAWIGIPKFGTNAEVITPQAETAFEVDLRDGGATGVDTMVVIFNWPGVAYWPSTYVSYDNPADEPELVTGFEPPVCDALPPLMATELSHTFETATSSVLLSEIVESASDVEYGAADPAGGATPVGEFIRTGAQFQELQFRLDPTNAVDFTNLTTISLDVYLPSTNTYGAGALTQNVFVGFGATTCPPNWWEDLHQYEMNDVPLDAWTTVTFDLASPSNVVVPGNGVTVFERNDLDMVYVQIGGGDHTVAGTFYIRNFVIN